MPGSVNEVTGSPALPPQGHPGRASLPGRATKWNVARTARAIGARLLNSALLLLAVVVLNFILIHSAPGDPADVIAGEMGGATPEMMAEIRARYGLDKPLALQAYIYVKQVATGNLGYSYFFNQPVSSLILRRVPPTVMLMVFSISMAALLGVTLGVLASIKPNSVASHLVTAFSLAGYASPVFWTGLILMLIFGRFWPIFPINGMFDIVSAHKGLALALDVLRHMALPSLSLILLNAAQFSRLTRASMLENLSMDYVRTARAKGLGEARVFLAHALRNALMPVVTMVGLQFGPLLAGAVVVETVFGWPGLGRLVFDSILRRDYPVLLGILLISACLVVMANLITDLVYRLVDPRVKGKA